ncbi:hypothetical protein PG994_004125 [Apiospora phragmitis]|uniref:Zn(2)-C6 fungal-type domain-containing protein n=1 Tax=Apiospora phragmitis TaxID=2905665 RepID=A0ABR1VPP4_9PEZI
MVTPACYTSSETSRRYSRACPPYPLGYLDRRYPQHHHLPSHRDTRLAKTMVERDIDDAPRKRIAVACGRCRKRKIRCSGDPGNGGPCSNCKNAGHEPCLFLRVSSTETHLRDGSGDYGYNVETARTYHARSSGGSLSPLAAFNAAAVMADGAAYRQNSYSGYAAAGSKGYYSAAAWTGAGAYPDDGGVAAEYGLGGYPAYPTTTAHLGQDPAEQLYRYGSSSSSKAAAAAAAAAGSVYVDPAEAVAASSYHPYGSLVHRPATAAAVAAAVSSSSELPNFSLSSMAASLPSSSQNSHGGSGASDRLPNPHRTLSSSSSSVPAYRTADGLPPSSTNSTGSPYASKASTSAASSTDVVGGSGGYGDFGDSPASYSTGASSSAAATLSGRSMSGQYAPASADYGAADHGGGSYVYSDSKLSGSPLTSPRRGSHAAAALSNGHDYVPVSHSHAQAAHHPSYGGGSHYDAHHHQHQQHQQQHHHHSHHHSHRAQQQQQEYHVGAAEGATTAGSGSGAT